jgi:ATPase subunit of ABC transporter with duplicated ATPase domains
MDEPSNHLDMQTIDALVRFLISKYFNAIKIVFSHQAEAINDFEGGMVLVREKGCFGKPRDSSTAITPFT